MVDAAGVFAAAGEPARDALGRTMQLTWEVTRVVAGALIEQQRPGRIVLVAPRGGCRLAARQQLPRACDPRGPREPRADAVDRVVALRASRP